ncbi:MAG: hypothetical protein NTX79_06610 [Candidatus Micrarchaeota archaeon]|nr:hypothetical protein [Candidatus Micrarchaeota archaeon]
MYSAMASIPDFRCFTNGKNPAATKRMAIVLPHKNEHEPLFPVQLRLAACLEKEKIRATTAKIEDSMERGFKAASFQCEALENLYFAERDSAVSAALMLQDYLVRARFISKIIGNGKPPVFVLELHAADSTFWESLDSPEAADFYKKLDGTNLLVASFLSGAQDTFWKIKMLRNNVFQGAAAAARLAGFDFTKALGALQGICGKLLNAKMPILCVETPAKGVPLPKSHPMYGHYISLEYPDGRFRLNNGTPDFEARYCATLLKPIDGGIPDAWIATLARAIAATAVN